MASLQERVIGVLRLQASTFEEVEADASATSQAAIIVTAAAVSGAIGVIRLGIGLGLVTIVFALIGWLIGSFVLHLVGTKIMPGKNTQADLGQVLRTTGFASAPKLFAILSIIPILGLLISFVIAIWALIAMVIGVKAALDYDDYVKPIIACIITAIIVWICIAVPTMLIFGGALMMGAGR